jgi:hypothetical protein
MAGNFPAFGGPGSSDQSKRQFVPFLYGYYTMRKTSFKESFAGKKFSLFGHTVTIQRCDIGIDSTYILVGFDHKIIGAGVLGAIPTHCHLSYGKKN